MAIKKVINPKAPPIKIQGIKTKIIPMIAHAIKWDGRGKWIEPFLGSGVVLFNLAPKKALVADTNKHIIRLYQSVQSEEITSSLVQEYLEDEGQLLATKGEEHYYAIRERFNKEGSPLDFIFLNRACFNGVMRFNSKGGFNVPFCRKPDRYRQALITKICNQVAWISHQMQGKDWEFKIQDWRETLSKPSDADFLYLDPPYYGRHTDYFNSWTEKDADDLSQKLRDVNCGFAYSMWKKNKYRENEHLIKWFSDYPMITQSHFYHVGASEDLRNEMEEALVIQHGFVADQFDANDYKKPKKIVAEQPELAFA